MEFDIAKCFDTIDRHRLVNILKTKIEDLSSMDLIHKIFHAGLVGGEKKGGPSGEERVLQIRRTPPRGARNIYPDPLDKEVQRIQHTPPGNYANGPEIFLRPPRLPRKASLKLRS